MAKLSRRDFLKAGAAAGIVAGTGFPARATTKQATDWVTLGNSGVKVTRLAFGTGTYGGRLPREMGQQAFTALVRHAYDSGIRFFETAESYRGVPPMLGEALKGLPCDSYRLMTKYTVREGENPQAKIDTFRRDLNTEYFDILMRCMRIPNLGNALGAGCVFPG